MAINEISRDVFDRFFEKQYGLACVLLDCEAFKSWHTPSRDEWFEVFTTIKKMVKRFEWPLFEVAPAGEGAAMSFITNARLMFNGIHQLLHAFNGHTAKSVPSPRQWGDIMRVVDETTERRALVDEAAKS